MRNDIQINWQTPRVKAGWVGAIEKFMGPGKTKSESMIEVVALILISGLIFFRYKQVVIDSLLAKWQLAILVLLLLDLVGGVITNSTNAAKRSYHESPSSKGRFIFIFCHTIHLLVISLLFLNFDWYFLAFNSAVLFLGAFAIERVQIQTKRPLAMLLFMAVVGVHSFIFQLPTYLELFPALFYLKLFVCFLVTEVPAYGNQSHHG